MRRSPRGSALVDVALVALLLLVVFLGLTRLALTSVGRVEAAAADVDARHTLLAADY